MIARILVLAAFAPAFGLAADEAAAPAPPGTPPGKPPGTIEERVEVARHLIDVAVMDSEGRPLAGLTVSNFKVIIDGDPREVRSVDPVSRPANSAAGSPPGTAPAVAASVLPVEPRWLVIVFDAERIALQARQFAVDVARTILREQVRPDDRVAVILLKGGDLVPAQTFARARDVQGTVAIDPSQLLGMTSPLDQKVTEMVEMVAQCRQSSDPAGCGVTATSEFLQLTRQENARAVRALRDLIASMAPLPGRKALVLISDGFILEPGQIAVDALSRFTEAGARTFARLADPRTWDYEALLAEASAARLSIFALRTGGSLALGMNTVDQRWVASDKDRAAFNPFGAAARSVESSLRQMADATGGMVTSVVTASKVPPILRHLESVYTLAVPVQSGDSIRSKLDVKLVGIKGKISAPSRLAYRGKLPTRLGCRVRITAQAAPGDPSVAHIELDTASLKLPHAGASEPAERRVALYYRLVDATGAVVLDDYGLYDVPRDAGRPAAFTLDVPLTSTAGSYVFEVNASDIAGYGRGTCSEPLAVANP